MDWIEWDFRDARDVLRDRSGAGLVLDPGRTGAVWRADPVVGGAMQFDGVDDYLSIPAAAVGPLHVAGRGDRVSVIALVRRDSHDTGFVAGMWQEDDADPRRQYGLFLSLPTYGGSQQVIGHVSGDGRPSGALPYSRDYAASARMVAPGSWRVVAFSYDGERIVSYLDGVADARSRFTEVGPPLGEGLRYAKNPYRYRDGLNRLGVSDFTVGAVRLSAGMGNHLAGAIARLAVVPAALEAAEVMSATLAWTPAGRPLVDLDFYQPPFEVGADQGGWPGEAWPAEVLGLVSSSAGAMVHAGRLRLPAGRTVVTLNGIEGLAAEHVGAVEVDVVAGPARVVALVGERWQRSAPLDAGSHRLAPGAIWPAAGPAAPVRAIGVAAHGADVVVDAIRLRAK